MNKKESMNSVNRFSLSLLKLNQPTNDQKDELYEFNAPKFFDFSTLPESPVGNDLNIDPWFLINHSDQSKLVKASKHPRKKKYSKYQKDNDAEANSRYNEFKMEKRTKQVNINNKTKMSMMIKPMDSLNLSKERNNNFKRSQSVVKTFDNIKKLKRGISTDTYTYYNSKCNKEEKEKENVEGNKKAVSKIKITYCPRIHDAKVMKKWEEKKGIKWYNLSPASREKANDEISVMIKTNVFENQK